MNVGRPGYNEAVRAVPMPERIRALPVSARGYPVPWFVALIDGVPDFRVVAPGRLTQAVKGRRCWVCGQPLGRYMAMTLGPMCAINRTVSEPPSHRDCAVFSARACPFLANPRMRRNEVALPEERTEAPGVHLRRNPGAVAVWITEGYTPFRAGDGVLFTFDDPVEITWFAEGRPATRAEVQASIDGGMPALKAAYLANGPDGLAQLRGDLARALPLLPT